MGAAKVRSGSDNQPLLGAEQSITSANATKPEEAESPADLTVPKNKEVATQTTILWVLRGSYRTSEHHVI